MKQPYVIGLDIGTSSIKGALVDASGKRPPVTFRVPFRYETDETGKVEISAESYLNCAYTALRSLFSSLPENGTLAGICAGSASGNALFLDSDHRAMTPIFNWQDTQTKAEESDAVLGADFDLDAYYRSTGWGYDKRTFPLAVLCRYAVRNPAILREAGYFCMSTEYLYYNLTGSWGISTSAGTPFYLIDQKTASYRNDILERFGLLLEQLPPVVPIGSVIGIVTEEASSLCGIPAGVPVIAGAFDHPSAARGVGVLKPGQMLLSCGTSWVGFYPIAERELVEQNHMLIDPFLSEKGGPWAGMVSLASVSARIEEYIRSSVANEGNIYKQFESYAKQSKRGAGGLKITFSEEDDLNYIRSFGKPEIARAIMEGVVGKLALDFERLSRGGVSASDAVMVGGPTECPFWTTVIEELTGIRVGIRNGAYAGAIGSSFLAGIGVGLWENEAHANQIVNH